MIHRAPTVSTGFILLFTDAGRAPLAVVAVGDAITATHGGQDRVARLWDGGTGTRGRGAAPGGQFTVYGVTETALGALTHCTRTDSITGFGDASTDSGTIIPVGCAIAATDGSINERTSFCNQDAFAWSVRCITAAGS